MDRLPIIRAALALLCEEPPLDLGRSKLALALLPREMSAASRGEKVRKLLRGAVEQIRPAGEMDATNRSWWPYLILVGEFVEGHERGYMREVLAIAESTYTHAKGRGLEKVAGIIFRVSADRAALLRELLGDNVMGAMDRMRVQVRRYARNPHSPERQEALMQSVEDVIAEQVNHIYSVCGSLVVGPIETLREQLREIQPQERAVGE